MFYIYDWEHDYVTSIEANKNYPANNIKTDSLSNRKKTSAESFDFSSYNKKCLHVALHPKEDIIAVGASNNLFLYEGVRASDAE
jgi:hypothetical protein